MRPRISVHQPQRRLLHRRDEVRETDRRRFLAAWPADRTGPPEREVLADFSQVRVMADVAACPVLGLAAAVERAPMRNPANLKPPQPAAERNSQRADRARCAQGELDGFRRRRPQRKRAGGADHRDSPLIQSKACLSSATGGRELESVSGPETKSRRRSHHPARIWGLGPRVARLGPHSDRQKPVC